MTSKFRVFNLTDFTLPVPIEGISEDGGEVLKDTVFLQGKSKAVLPVGFEVPAYFVQTNINVIKVVELVEAPTQSV